MTCGRTILPPGWPRGHRTACRKRPGHGQGAVRRCRWVWACGVTPGGRTSEERGRAPSRAPGLRDHRHAAAAGTHTSTQRQPVDAPFPTLAPVAWSPWGAAQGGGAVGWLEACRGKTAWSLGSAHQAAGSATTPDTGGLHGRLARVHRLGGGRVWWPGGRPPRQRLQQCLSPRAVAVRAGPATGAHTHACSATRFRAETGMQRRGTR